MGNTSLNLSSWIPLWLSGLNLRAMLETQEMQVWLLGWEETLEEGMVTCSSILAWRIPWTEEPDGLESMELRRVGHYRVAEHTRTLHTETRGTFFRSIILSYTSTSGTIPNQRRQCVIMFKTRALKLGCLGLKLGFSTTAVWPWVSYSASLSLRSSVYTM